MRIDLSDDTECLRREVQRLHGLSKWVRQNGQRLNVFAVIMAHAMGEQGAALIQEAAQAMPLILDALADAGEQPEGLRLRELEMPVFGSTPIHSVTRALSGCHQLRRLRLLDSCNGRSQSSAEALRELPAGLQALTQLTYLRLHGGLFWHNGTTEAVLDGIVESLPSSLVEIEVDDYDRPYTGRACHLSSRSLGHLRALQKLTLPNYICVTSSTDGSSDSIDGATSSSSSSSSRRAAAGDCTHLAQLKALTYLACGTALMQKGAPLLALPNLVELGAGPAEPEVLEKLSGKTALRSLGCFISPSHHVAQAIALEQLTQLRELGVIIHDVQEDLLHDAAAEGVGPVALEAIAALRLGVALSTMTGLRQLRLESGLLERVIMHRLTALTSIWVDVRCARDYPGDPYGLSRTMLQLTPLRGRLQEVGFVSLPLGLKVVCCNLVAAAVGDHVDVQFV
jgi:hypothetical protein